MTRKRHEQDPSTARNEPIPEPSEAAGQGAAPPEFPDGDWADFVAARSRFLRDRGMDDDDATERSPTKPRPRYVHARSRFSL